MQYRSLGKTGLKVSVIGFGGFPIGYVQPDEAVEALNKALDLGVNFIDTAPSYDDSEEKIGVVLKERKDECFIATKTNKYTADEAMKDIERSLTKLHVDRIDLHQIHDTANELEAYRRVVGPGGALEALKKAKAQGKIDHIGIAVHWALDVMKEAIRSQEFETLMISFSPLDQEGVAREVIPLAKEHDVGVIVMKSLLEGDLTTPGSSGGRLARLHGIRGRHPVPNDNLVEGCLKYVLSVPGVSTVIPGMTSVAEVEEDTRVGDMPLHMTESERGELYNQIGRLGRRFNPFGQTCLHCGYCEPCPEGVKISETYRAWDMYVTHPPYPKNLNRRGLDLFRSMQGKTGICTECRQCEENCPARLPIASQLRHMQKKMEAALEIETK